MCLHVGDTAQPVSQITETDQLLEMMSAMQPGQGRHLGRNGRVEAIAPGNVPDQLRVPTHELVPRCLIAGGRACDEGRLPAPAGVRSFVVHLSPLPARRYEPPIARVSVACPQALHKGLWKTCDKSGGSARQKRAELSERVKEVVCPVSDRDALVVCITRDQGRSAHRRQRSAGTRLRRTGAGRSKTHARRRWNPEIQWSRPASSGAVGRWADSSAGHEGASSSELPSGAERDRTSLRLVGGYEDAGVHVGGAPYRVGDRDCRLDRWHHGSGAGRAACETQTRDRRWINGRNGRGAIVTARHHSPRWMRCITLACQSVVFLVLVNCSGPSSSATTSPQAAAAHPCGLVTMPEVSRAL